MTPPRQTDADADAKGYRMTRFARPLRHGTAAVLLLLAVPAAAQTAAAPAATAGSAPAASAPAAAAAPAVPAAQPAPADAATPLPSAAPAAPAPAPAAIGDLPKDLSVSGMFHSADAVVRAVMIALLAASVLTWTILLAKGIQVIAAGRELKRELKAAEAGRTVSELQIAQGRQHTALAVMVRAVGHEIVHSAGAPAGGVKERIGSRLHRIEAGLSRRMMRGTGILATIGSTAPFVGLFGTVWGIMNSFVGISQSHTTNLAVVAPGIAEALLATATGLVAAIPAVVIYNIFARALGGYKAQLADLSASLMRLASRDLDLRRGVRAAAAE